MEKVNYYSLRQEIGLVLSIVGMQFATILRNVVKIECTQLVMLLSVLLIINYKNAFNIRFNKGLTLLFIYQIYCFVWFFNHDYYNSIDHTYDEASVSKMIFYHLYLIMLMYSLCTIRIRKEFRYFLRISFYVGLFIMIEVLDQVTLHFTTLTNMNLLAENYNQLAEGGDKSTLGRALLFLLFVCVVYKGSNKLERYLRFGAIAGSWICLFMFNTRAAMAVFFLGFIYYLWQKRYFSQKRIRTLIAYAVIAVGVLMVFYTSVEYFRNAVDHFIESFLSGIGTYLGFSNVIQDTSANMRLEHFPVLIDAMYNSSLIQLFFGHGYYSTFADMPIFQALLDSGIFIAIFYFYLMVIKPSKYLLSFKTKLPELLLLIMVMIQYLFDQFYGGSCYTFFMYPSYIIFMYYIYSPKMKQYV